MRLKGTVTSGVGGLTIAAAMAFSMSPGLAHEDASHDAPANATQIWDVARGGQLYDNWIDVLDADTPQGNHPLYPEAGKKSGATTWRCKECHGWDLKGSDGAYRSGSHFTGIAGLRSLEGIDPATIEAKIMAPEHGFADKLPQQAAQKLALFLSKGQIDDDRYIDPETKVVRGNPDRGARVFQTICAVCHGYDGKEMNFHSDDDPEFVGTIANDNPYELFHKIRFGQPGVGMVALGALDIDLLVDILSYTQTLPEK